MSRKPTDPVSRRFAPGVAAGLFALAVVPLLTGCTGINVRLAMNQGVSHYKAKEFEKAAEKFQEAITLNPGHAEAYLDLGLTYMELYEPGSEHEKDKAYAEGAIQAFKKYIRMNPESEKVEGYLINICKLSHRMPDAIDFYLEDYQKNSQEINLVKKLANLYHMSGDTEKAVEFFEKVAQLDPTSPEALYSVGVACWGRSYNAPFLDYDSRMALLDKGVGAMDRALALKPDYYEALAYLNLLYREKSKYDISPAQSVIWRQKADELQAKSMDLRNKALAAQAAEAAKAAGDKPAPASGTTH